MLRGFGQLCDLGMEKNDPLCFRKNEILDFRVIFNPKYQNHDIIDSKFSELLCLKLFFED